MSHVGFGTSPRTKFCSVGGQIASIQTVGFDNRKEDEKEITEITKRHIIKAEQKGCELKQEETIYLQLHIWQKPGLGTFKSKKINKTKSLPAKHF